MGGGQLRYWSDDDGHTSLDELRDGDAMLLDTQAGFALFDGKRAHSVEPFSGQRYSLIFYSVRRFEHSLREDRDALAALGVPFPEDAACLAYFQDLLAPP